MLFSTPAYKHKIRRIMCFHSQGCEEGTKREIIICFHSQDCEGRVEIIIVFVVKIVWEGTNRIVFIVKVAYGQHINCFFGLNKSWLFWHTHREFCADEQNFLLFLLVKTSDSKSVGFFSTNTLSPRIS
jgi:hypothetical protein